MARKLAQNSSPLRDLTSLLNAEMAEGGWPPIYSTSSGRLGPLMSTPKRAGGERMLFEPLVSEISPAESSDRVQADRRGAESGRSTAMRNPQLFGVQRGHELLYFGFVALGESEVLQQRLVNKSGEQLRVRCRLERVGHTSSPEPCVFETDLKITSVSSMIVEPGAELLVSVRYTPIACRQYADVRLIVERVNGEYRKFSFKMLGYGGRADLRLDEKLIMDAIAVPTPSGVFVLTPDIYPPPPLHATSRFQFSLKNEGHRSCFVVIKAMKVSVDEELEESYVRVQPSSLVIGGIGGERSNRQVIKVRINNRLKPVPRRDVATFGRSLSPSAVCSRSDCEFQLLVIWGEELQRQRLRRWSQREVTSGTPRRDFSAYDRSFTKIFDGEALLTKNSHSSMEKSLENEDQEFLNSLRLLRINVVNNQVMCRPQLITGLRCHD